MLVGGRDGDKYKQLGLKVYLDQFVAVQQSGETQRRNDASETQFFPLY